MNVRVAPLTWLLLAGCTDPVPSTPVAPTTERVPPPRVEAPHQDAPDDWKHELAWARTRFPELRDYSLEVDFQPLLAWVPEGKEVSLYINVQYDKRPYHCAEARAVRASPNQVSLVIPGPERIEGSQSVRDYVSADVKPSGVEIFYAGGVERRKTDGTWEKIDGYATTGLDLGGSIGPVTSDTAYFRYIPVRIEASCGPLVEAPCAGVSRRCNRCEQISVALVSPKTTRRTPPPEVSVCAEPCPKIDNPDLERLRRIAEHFVTGLVPASDPLGVAIYRTREACRNDPLWTRGPEP